MLTRFIDHRSEISFRDNRKRRLQLLNYCCLLKIIKIKAVTTCLIPSKSSRLNYNLQKYGFAYKKKILEYQQKKLVQAENSLKSHIAKKERLEEIGSEKDITNQDKMIKIWSTNIEKIKQEINKIQMKE